MQNIAGELLLVQRAVRLISPGRNKHELLRVHPQAKFTICDPQLPAKFCRYLEAPAMVLAEVTVYGLEVPLHKAGNVFVPAVVFAQSLFLVSLESLLVLCEGCAVSFQNTLRQPLSNTLFDGTIRKRLSDPPLVHVARRM